MPVQLRGGTFGAPCYLLGALEKPAVGLRYLFPLLICLPHLPRSWHTSWTQPMARRTARRALAENALKIYAKYARLKSRLRAAKRAATSQHPRSPGSSSSSLDSLSSLSTSSDSSTSNSSSEDDGTGSSDSDWSDLFGPHWRYSRRSRQIGSSRMDSSEGDGSGLGRAGMREGLDWDMSSSESSDSSSTSSSSGDDGDEEWSDGGDGESLCSLNGMVPPSLGSHVRNFVEVLYEQCYHVPCEPLPHPEEPYLHHVLNVLKVDRPDHFREKLHVSP